MRSLREELESLGVKAELRPVKALSGLVTQLDRVDGSWIIYYSPMLLRKYEVYVRQIVRHEVCHIMDIEEGLYDLYQRSVSIDSIDEYVKCVYLAFTDLIACKRYAEMFDDYSLYIKFAAERARLNAPISMGVADFFGRLKYLVTLVTASELGISVEVPARTEVYSLDVWDLVRLIYRDLVKIAKLGSWNAASKALVSEALMTLAYIKGRPSDVVGAISLLELTSNYCSDLVATWLARLSERLSGARRLSAEDRVTRSGRECENITSGAFSRDDS